MPPKDKARTGSGYASTPPALPASNPVAYPSSADYSLATLQAVMEMQKAIGELTESVKSLKDQSKSHAGKLEEIGKDVHGAKVAVRVIAVIAAGFIGLAGWLINMLWKTLHP